MNLYAIFSAIFTFTNIKNVSSGKSIKSTKQLLTSLVIKDHKENISFFYITAENKNYKISITPVNIANDKLS